MLYLVEVEAACSAVSRRAYRLAPRSHHRLCLTVPACRKYEHHEHKYTVSFQFDSIFRAKVHKLLHIQEKIATFATNFNDI
jgi:hypothetical protein